MRRSVAGIAAVAALLTATPLVAEDGNEQIARSAVASIGGAAEVGTVAEPQSATPASAVAAAPAEAPSSVALGASLAQWQPPRPPITLVLNADLGAQRLTVVENGKVQATWLISSGRAGYATPKGTFRPQWMSKMWFSRQYDDAPMPHAVFFNGGVAFHGTSAVGMLGRPASHGCVRLHPGNAAQLFKLVSRHGVYQTKVVVHGGPKSREPAVAGRPGKGPKQKVAKRQGPSGVRVASQDEPGRRRVARGGGRASSSYGSPYGWSSY